MMAMVMRMAIVVVIMVIVVLAILCAGNDHGGDSHGSGALHSRWQFGVALKTTFGQRLEI